MLCYRKNFTNEKDVFSINYEFLCLFHPLNLDKKLDFVLLFYDRQGQKAALRSAMNLQRNTDPIRNSHNDTSRLENPGRYTSLLLATDSEQMIVAIEASGKSGVYFRTIEVNSPAYVHVSGLH